MRCILPDLCDCTSFLTSVADNRVLLSPSASVELCCGGLPLLLTIGIGCSIFDVYLFVNEVVDGLDVCEGLDVAVVVGGAALTASTHRAIWLT